ncbi:adenosine deaminase [Arachnia propionica]|uniref:adenosine deaminase n=1 Tax=Arachnia propionica TaxID=1750 RepID=A0A3P1T8V4_9ACTN|nr:adenosine deaminase [Arachnia propionica]RRD05770.1 adenosine deaminase [Arachnia propionica]
MLTVEELRVLPKVALHDHLDGGLRPQTVIEHCAENGHDLPTTDPEELRRWFFEAADSGSLVRYLEGFAHTCAAMQTRDQLVRVAREFVLDQAADGVVYAEARWAPEQHLEQGLSLTQAVEAVRDGLAWGMADAEAAGQAIVATQLVTAMRHVEQPTTEIAQLALQYRDDSVVGFDIAGAEYGFRPSRFRDSFELLRRNNAHITIHAGEADGPESMWEAIQLCGAQRIGHGVRIVEDIEDLHGPRPRLGRLAAFVRDQQIPLEVCPTSNTQTGIAATVAEHPVGRLAELGFNVTIHCDNRLMSGTTLSQEFAKLSEAFGWGLAEVERATVAAMRAAFLHHDEREALVDGLIRPAYRAARHGKTA